MTENKKKIIVLVLTVLIAISLIFTGVNFGKYIRSRENVKTDKTTGDEKETTPDFIAELNNGDEVTSEDEQVLPEEQPTQEKPAKEEPAKEEPDSGDHSKKVFDESDTNNDDWLHTDGSKIYDQSGKQVWLTGINWFGYNTGTNAFDGLWACDLNTSIEAIANHGFNLLRVPFSAELILEWEKGNYPNANFNQATNDYLVGKTSLEIWDYVVDLCRTNGIKIMVDIHSAKTDSMGHMTNMWYTDSRKVRKQTSPIQ